MKDGPLYDLNYNIKDGDKPWTAVIYIERKCDGMKEEFFYGNIEGFLVGKSDSELLGLLYSKMLGVSEYTKVGGELDYKEGTSIGVYAWSVESITEVNMLGFIAICLKCSLLGMFQWYSKIVKE